MKTYKTSKIIKKIETDNEHWPTVVIRLYGKVYEVVTTDEIVEDVVFTSENYLVVEAFTEGLLLGLS